VATKSKSHTAKKPVAPKHAETPRRTTGQGKDATKNQTAKKTKPTGEKKSAAAQHGKPARADREVAVDRRRDDRRNGDRRKGQQPVVVELRKLERRAKVNRRRQIDPTTCERDYTPEELEFMSALDEYKRTSGRMFPTCSEILEVFAGLGYRKIGPIDETTTSPTGAI